MTNNGNGKNEDARKLSVTVNRNEERGYTIFSIEDPERETDKVLADFIIPDAALIQETYRLGGNVRPIDVIGEIVKTAAAAMLNTMDRFSDLAGPEAP